MREWASAIEKERERGTDKHTCTFNPFVYPNGDLLITLNWFSSAGSSNRLCGNTVDGRLRLTLALPSCCWELLYWPGLNRPTLGPKKVRKWMKINRVGRALDHQETELLVLFLWHWAAEGLDCLWEDVCGGRKAPQRVGPAQRKAVLAPPPVSLRSTGATS